MGKAGRVFCIFTPVALTIASFICLVFIELSGWSSTTGALNKFYFFQADFTTLDVNPTSGAENTATLTAALTLAKNNNALANVYQIHLWNYCNGTSNSTVDKCSARESGFVFDPVEIWGLAAVNATSTAATGTSGQNAIQSEAAALKNNAEALEGELLGKAGKEALDAYKKVAKWMFVAYEISFWTTLATIVCSILAIFSRWGSFLTWLFSFVSSFFTFAAVLTSTVLFAALVGALEEILKPYRIHLTLSTPTLTVTWLGVLFSWAATLFWLFSVCCCSGRSNPHHRSNKGGLWAAEAKGQGYGGPAGRGRGLRVEKTGGGYERVSSPFLGGQEHGDRVPLQDYPQPTAYGGGPAHAHQQQQSGAYEPFRRQY